EGDTAVAAHKHHASCTVWLQNSQCVATARQTGVPAAINGDIFVQEKVLCGGVSRDGLGINAEASTIHFNDVTTARQVDGSLHTAVNRGQIRGVAGITAPLFIRPDVKPLVRW